MDTITIIVNGKEYKAEIPEGAISFDYCFAMRETDYIFRVSKGFGSILLQPTEIETSMNLVHQREKGE